MFDPDPKLIRRMQPKLQRVLIADPLPQGARLLSELMLSIFRSQVWTATDSDKALAVAETSEPTLVFVEFDHERVNGVDFTRRLRRSKLAARYAPVIMLTSHATQGGIVAARDAGVNEFLRRPFTTNDLLRRLEAVTLRKRDWVEAVGYIGPDRRRFNSGDYTGPLKRRSDSRGMPAVEKLDQAQKILRSAIAAMESDPAQAMRSMQTQATDLQKVGAALGDIKLVTAGADFASYLFYLEASGDPMVAAQVEARAAMLLNYKPPETSAVAREG